MNTAASPFFFTSASMVDFILSRRDRMARIVDLSSHLPNAPARAGSSKYSTLLDEIPTPTQPDQSVTSGSSALRWSRATLRDPGRAARETMAKDKQIDLDYRSAVRELVTYMMEDPRSISRVMNVLWALRALERIGDHAKNICEHIVFLVEGKDIRHGHDDAQD